MANAMVHGTETNETTITSFIYGAYAVSSTRMVRWNVGFKILPPLNSDGRKRTFNTRGHVDANEPNSSHLKPQNAATSHRMRPRRRAAARAAGRTRPAVRAAVGIIAAARMAAATTKKTAKTEAATTGAVRASPRWTKRL